MSELIIHLNLDYYICVCKIGLIHLKETGMRKKFLSQVLRISVVLVALLLTPVLLVAIWWTRDLVYVGYHTARPRLSIAGKCNLCWNTLTKYSGVVSVSYKRVFRGGLTIPPPLKYLCR